MAKCVYDGKGIKPDCEHCIDTIGMGMVCTHDCVIELREEIEKRDSLLKELATSLKSYLVGDCIDCRQCAEGDEACDHHKKLGKLIADAREMTK